MEVMLKNLLGLLTLFLLLLACDQNKADMKEVGGQSGKEIASQVQVLDPDKLDSLIRDRNGKILLVNVWATWCVPCREEFPDLVKLADIYEARKIDFVGISTDYPDQIDSKIRPFIQEQNVNFPIYIQTFEKQEDFINYFNEDWSGALPATFIYDSSGKQQKFMLGKHDFEQFEQALEAVMAL